jgi:ArsR family transcriptional regulator
MNDAGEAARILDILGNRNRRRIIDLLRQKPCFVTEISDTLMISPKAVIEHLQMMERETILACQTDDRRRKYYFLANDILIDVRFRQTPAPESVKAPVNGDLIDSVAMLGRMIRAHDQILENLEQINREIEKRINDIAHSHKDIIRSEREITVIIALSHEPLTFGELEQVTEISQDALQGILKRLGKQGVLTQENNRYTIRGIHAQ